MSGHHILALWPVPQVAVALALTTLAIRFPLVAKAKLYDLAVVALLVANAWVVVSIHSQLHRTGGRGYWSDSVYALGDYLVEHNQPIVAVDWGFTLNLIVLSDGELEITKAYKEFWKKPISATTLAPFVHADTLYLCHEPGTEMFVGAREALLTAARERGLEALEEAAFSTRDGRKVCSVVRLVAP
jgi:hypothetical protein